MPYPEGHRERIRQRIIKSARKLFNRRGYAAVSIDEIMEGVGLTRGGFYLHFSSKSELFVEAVKHILVDHPARKWPGVDFDLSTNAARKIIEAYLGNHHLMDVDDSCPLVTQGVEAARGGAVVREAYQRVMDAMAVVLSRSVRSSQDKTEIGLAVTALCVGGLTLARGVGDPQYADAILKASRKAALQLGGWKSSSRALGRAL